MEAFLRRHLGKLNVITEEPNTLAYTSAFLAPSTSCRVHVNLTRASIDAQYLHNISLKVGRVLRSKTFYSAKDIPCFRNQTHLTDSELLRLYNDVRKAGKWKLENLEWTYVPTLGYQNGNGPSDKSQSDKVAAWISSLRFSISPKYRLQATFCTKHVARSYSLLFRIHITGVYVEMVDFEAPLQVVFPPTEMLDSHSFAHEAN
ncbi:hypothetical protein TRIATDRAFT_308306 [Trichoderma atroviride IMI 206040]|uniref:Uncharacterized protein n=1 Tax=Hypocrea atroviridis (strain ATCC 20476 / IMI 206040) TaxID=452589 RepID=G9NXD3_HYPAI|nr:uncharacterized protein TRIATDRAFT_308306 [Trichoderma atroviride IMI 206040]EHK44744.1 hypothetical protein TRIATDRAFT_308306 [Trichoderma atroviride IMI 206040]